MPPRTQAGSKELGDAMRARREELGLTVEQAASRAHVGQKTWSRYESGESIRSDKIKGVCASLGWKTLSDAFASQNDFEADGSYLKSIDDSHDSWSPFIERACGRKAAVTFCIGSDILLDELRMDLGELETMPRGTHLGMIGVSLTLPHLPAQFVMQYDYEFVYKLAARLSLLRDVLRHCDHFNVHMVADELLLHMIEEEAALLMEGWENQPDDYLSDAWVADICGDDDFSLYLKTPLLYLGNQHDYHFNHWFDHQLNTHEIDWWTPLGKEALE